MRCARILFYSILYIPQDVTPNIYNVPKPRLLSSADLNIATSSVGHGVLFLGFQLQFQILTLPLVLIATCMTRHPNLPSSLSRYSCSC